MNPNRGEHQQPAEEVLIPQQGYERLQETSVESASNEESGLGKKQPSPVSNQTSTNIPVPQPSVVATTQQDDQSVTATAQTSPVASDDKDKIEKEWVSRAKAVVARTLGDPHKQKKEMSEVKADYILKRFNKTIKTDDLTPQ